MIEEIQSLRADRASWANELQTLKEKNVKHVLDGESRQKRLIKAIETERQGNLASKRSLASSEARS